MAKSIEGNDMREIIEFIDPIEACTNLLKIKIPIRRIQTRKPQAPHVSKIICPLLLPSVFGHILYILL